jgi:hypothetical protein
MLRALLPALRLHTLKEPVWGEPTDPVIPTRLQIGDSLLEVRIATGELDPSREQLLRWITKAGSAAASYYGRFPIALTRIAVHPVRDRSGVFHGTTWGSSPPLTRISVGQHTTQEQLDRDWMMTHELIHLAFPDVAEEHHWIEEGIATYVEPIARTLISDLTPASIWSDMMDSMHLGEPGPLDQGLNHTHTWGRTYWGGALFCLTADVRIRQATGNQKGLRDALRAILQAGGTIDHRWSVTKAFEIADRATHTQVLTAMYSEMGDKAVPVDLDELWRQLGVSKTRGKISLDENAPLAAIRRSITSPTG